MSGDIAKWVVVGVTTRLMNPRWVIGWGRGQYGMRSVCDNEDTHWCKGLPGGDYFLAHWNLSGLMYRLYASDFHLPTMDICGPV